MKVPTEQGDPVSGRDGFRRALGEFATGVTVITTYADGKPYGMTSNSFSSVSLDPPLVLWSIRRESQSFAAFADCAHFVVNVLAADQIDLSQAFARSGPDKFEGLNWTSGPGGAPVLDKVSAVFECRRTEVHEGGDHLILLGQVERYTRYDRQPLLFAKGRYAVAADHPDTQVFAAPYSGHAQVALDEQILSILMVRAYGAIAANLEKERRAAGLGLSLMQARLLKAIHSHPDSTLEELLPELFLDFNSSQQAMETLVSLELIVLDANGKVQLTPKGEQQILAIIEHTRAGEEKFFRRVSKEDLATVQLVLRTIIAETPE